jgi:hypothetical protein
MVLYCISMSTKDVMLVSVLLCWDICRLRTKLNLIRKQASNEHALSHISRLCFESYMSDVWSQNVTHIVFVFLFDPVPNLLNINVSF